MDSSADPTPQLTRAQRLLVEFLRADLELAFTFLRTAEIEAAADNSEHELTALAEVRKALNSIRHLAERVHDPKTRDEIEAGTKQLEAAIVAFQNAMPVN